MPWNLTNEEIDAVLSLNGPSRYEYCLKRVADQRRLWSLRHRSGWALAADDAGNLLVPVWPHERFATLCASDEWSGYEAISIGFNEWRDRWMPGMEKDGRFVAVFPTPSAKGIEIDPKRFEADLLSELANYE